MNPAAANRAALSPDSIELLGLLAYIYLENNRPEKAAVLLSALETLGVADSRRRLSLALAQLRSGKPESAAATLERAALRGEVDAPFHLVRAQALLALDRRAEAAAAMRAYVALRAAAAPTDAAKQPATR